MNQRHHPPTGHPHFGDGRHPPDGTHEHEHGQAGPARRLARLRQVFRPHAHQPAEQLDRAMASAAGMRALWISVAILSATALFQAAVVARSGSVALLGETLHNAADVLTAVPLAVAFIVGRRPPTRRYTYGQGRAEDLAGVLIVVFMAASSALACYAAVTRLAHPRPVSGLAFVAVAALAGFTGNELVAWYRIRTGRRIGSAALVADGLHARTDGLASLAVLAAVGGVALGWGWADPVTGLLIMLVILAVLRQAALEVYRRLMDAVDPALVDRAERALRGTPGVLDAGQMRLRWVGHELRGECEIVVDDRASAVAAHQVAAAAEHQLRHALPHLTAVLVHADPQSGRGTGHHAALAVSRARPEPGVSSVTANVAGPPVPLAAARE